MFLQPLLQWKSNKYYIFWVCVCSLRHPARKAHAPYCHRWPARFYHIFPHYLIKGTIFENTLSNIKCVFWFSLQLFSDTYLIPRRNERDMIKMYVGLHVKYLTCLFDFKEILIFKTDFPKILKYQISWKSVKWKPIYSTRTDTRKLIVTFRKFTNAPKNDSNIYA